MSDLSALRRVPRLPAPNSPALRQVERYTTMGRALMDRETATKLMFTSRRFSVREACLILQISAATLRKWGRAGLIRLVRSGPRGWGFVPQSEITRLLNGNTLSGGESE